MVDTLKQKNLLEYGFPVQNSSAAFLKSKKEEKPTPPKHQPKKAPNHPTTPLQNAPAQSLISLGVKKFLTWDGMHLCFRVFCGFIFKKLQCS